MGGHKTLVTLGSQKIQEDARVPLKALDRTIWAESRLVYVRQVYGRTQGWTDKGTLMSCPIFLVNGLPSSKGTLATSCIFCWGAKSTNKAGSQKLKIQLEQCEQGQRQQGQRPRQRQQVQ